jgi:hypothetical protein
MGDEQRPREGGDLRSLPGRTSPVTPAVVLGPRMCFHIFPICDRAGWDSLRIGGLVAPSFEGVRLPRVDRLNHRRGVENFSDSVWGSSKIAGSNQGSVSADRVTSSRSVSRDRKLRPSW